MKFINSPSLNILVLMLMIIDVDYWSLMANVASDDDNEIMWYDLKDDVIEL